MPKKPARKPKEDFTQVAFRVFQHAIGEGAPPEPEADLSPKAAAGRKGGLAGGASRAKKLSPARRRKIARAAAAARWSKRQPR